MTAENRSSWDAPAPSWEERTGSRGGSIFIGSCGKKVYRRHRHAHRDAEVVNREKSRDQEGKAQAYWCRRCRGFHVGHRGKMR